MFIVVNAHDPLCLCDGALFGGFPDTALPVVIHSSWSMSCMSCMDCWAESLIHDQFKVLRRFPHAPLHVAISGGAVPSVTRVLACIGIARAWSNPFSSSGSISC
jgi:hypothetical protein